MENGKDNLLTWKLILKCILGVALALGICFGYPFLLVMLWAAGNDAKYERLEPEALEAAQAYLTEQYPGNDFEITKFYHNFKDNSFDAEIQSRSSVDTHFTVKIADDTLEPDYDSYVWDVLEGNNTEDRVEEEYSAAVQAVLSELFPEQIVGAVFQRRYYVRGDAQITEDMLADVQWEVDKQYDVSALGAQAGVVEVYFDNTEGKYPPERRMEVLRQMAQALEKAGMGFFTVEVWLAEELHNDSPAYCFVERIPKTELD